MAIDNFNNSLAAVLKDEGGLDNDPQDHGGKTAYGITGKEYDAWRLAQGLTPRDVWDITPDEYTTIYRTSYWDPWCDDLPAGIDYLFFDMRVNAGTHRATVLLQHALGVATDGAIGPITLKAIQDADPSTLVHKYSETKRAFYRSLNQTRFLKGWLNRCDHVESVALSMLR